MGSGFVLGIQSLVDNAFSIEQMNFFDAFYFMIITCTTIGYGDIVPTKTISRMFIVVMLFSLFIIITNQITTIINLFSVWGPSLVIFNGTGHIIVFADSSTNLKTFLEEIRIRKGRIPIVILSQDIAKLESKTFPFNKVTLLNYEINNLEFLARSNISHASAIFIFSNKSTRNCLINEKFIDSLLVKSNQFNNNIPIYIQSLYSEKNYHEIGKFKLKMKKNISIFRIKSLIIAKSLFNPGFPTFIQNLMFNNNNNISSLHFESFSVLYKEYQLGCQYKIHVLKLPACLFNKTFSEALKIIYFKSIKNCILQKNYNYINDRPVLLIGSVVVGNKEIKEKIRIFPQGTKISSDTFGVFLGYNDQADTLLEKFLEGLQLKQDEDEINEVIRLKTVSYPNNVKKATMFNEAISNDYRKKSITINNQERFAFNENLKRNAKIIPNLPAEKQPRNSLSISKEASNGNLNFITNRINSKAENKEKEDNIDNNNLAISQSQELFQKFAFDHTLKNINSELKFDYNIAPETKIQMKQKLEKFCNKRYRDLRDKEKEKEIHVVDYLFENRIFDLQNNSSHFAENGFNNHILLIGYQDNIHYLLKMLAFYFEAKTICLLNNDRKVETEIFKLLKYFNNLKYLRGDYSSPKILIKAGIKQCYYTLILSENIDPKINEDINNLVTFRSIEYYFNTKIILELWNYESINLLGNIPIDRKKKIISNEFLNPYFMAGKLIYLNHFEKIIAESYLEGRNTDTWLNLIYSGYRGEKEYIKYTNKIIKVKNRKNSHDNKHEELESLQTFPCFVTIDIPDFYFKREYHLLVADLLSLSCIPIGLYIEDPQIYSSVSEVYSRQTQVLSLLKRSDTRVHFLDLQTSSKKIQSHDEKTPEYNNALKILRSVSYNNKNFLDFQDFDNNINPVFLTNPSPNFKILNKTKVQVIYNYHLKDNNIENCSNENISIKNDDKNNSTERKISNYLQYKLKMKLLKKQEKFFSLYQNLRERYLLEYNKIISKIEGIN